MPAEPAIPHVIAEMLGPAVMVSGCGLLLLGLGNRYARVVDRLRSFTAEWRALRKSGPADAPDGPDAERLAMLEQEFPDLLRRGRLLRDAVLMLYSAALLFVAASFAIPLGAPTAAAVVFSSAMAAVLLGVWCAAREMSLSFRLILIEIPPHVRRPG
jgi:hypothetical protein